jgi:hypothetical protein
VPKPLTILSQLEDPRAGRLDGGHTLWDLISKQLVEYEVSVALALAGALVGLAAKASWGLR